MMVIGYDKDKGYVAVSSIGKVGRWCRPPHVPDNCYCWDAATWKHGEATGYLEQADRDGEVWRYGVCDKCRAKTQRWLDDMAADLEDERRRRIAEERAAP